MTAIMMPLMAVWVPNDIFGIKQISFKKKVQRINSLHPFVAFVLHYCLALYSVITISTVSPSSITLKCVVSG